MSRLSQTIDYINDTNVTIDDIKNKYTDIIITEELRMFKMEYQRKQREKEKEKRLLLLELERL
tara:strand:+ start:311 stop:499 length:189 start_codon:yes stop_codon:yes gene_type:complete